MYLTILFPCLNECETIGDCVKQANKYFARSGLSGEVLVVDNMSNDNSGEIACNCGARVIKENNKGYGNAVKCGIRNARGDFIILADCDGSYSLENLDIFIDKFVEGYEFVCGNRFKGGIEKGAMPLSHKIGVPILSYLARKRYSLDNIGDFHCGMRGFKTSIARSLDLKTCGMEFATELVVLFKNYKLIEIPVRLYKDKRISSKSHLKTYRDGVRHLSYILKGSV